jgi:type IX secretion system substrate protein/carboxypeptidase-like protein/von Willebrand factor type A domain-containing protein
MSDLVYDHYVLQQIPNLSLKNLYPFLLYSFRSKLTESGERFANVEHIIQNTVRLFMQIVLLIHLLLKQKAMRKRLCLLLLISILIAPCCFSQLLKGHVLTESGVAAAEVNVQFRNKANKITTNKDGRFTILATKLPDTLDFSAPGYEPYNVIVTEKNIKDPNFEVVLLSKRAELSEVVVVGYSTSKKRDMTGSVSSPSPESKISGEVAGVEVKRGKRGEDAETIRIRGTSSIYSTKGGGLDGRTNSDLYSLDSIAGSKTTSKILTAGEVNDFNKWKMWSDYTETDFKSSSEYWGMFPRKRYSVQLTDHNHNAVINAPIYLVSRSTHDTIWRAFTDNTGKAELWTDFANQNETKQDFIIVDGDGNKIDHPSEFANGVNVLSTKRSCGFSNLVDIAFVVDATGSMGDEIEFLKLELEDVIRNTMEKHKSLTLNAGSVFYRDRGDEYLTRISPFNDDLLKTINFIKLQHAGGGGDTPEAVDDALSTALDDLHWHPAARTRLLFLVLDAPAHDYARERMRQLTLKAAAMGVRIVPLACSGTDKPTEFLLRSMALATNGTYAFLTDDSGVGNSHIKPTTDKYEVELLTNLMQRIIGQFLYAKDCSLEVVKQTGPDVEHLPENVLSVKVYPNPTSGQFTIESTKDLGEIFITDFTGKILMRLPAATKSNRWQVDLSQYPSGVYLAKYITTDNKWGAEKVVVVR